MKRVSFLTGVLSIVFLIGCKKDKEKDTGPQPSTLSIQFVDAGETYEVFDTIRYSISASIPSGVSSASAGVLIGDAPIDIAFESGLDSALITISDTLSIVLGPDEIATSIKFAFTLTDLLGVTLTDTIATTVAESDILWRYGQSMGGFNNIAGYGSFYDILGDTAYFATGIRNKINLLKTIDLVYCYEATVKRSFTIPNADWAESVWNDQSPGTFWPMDLHENATLIYDLGTETDFDAVVSTGEITTLLESTDPGENITFVTTGRIVGFQLDSLRGGKVGLLKVTGTSGNSITTGTVTFDLKIQK